MFHFSIFGENSFDGSGLEPGESVFSFAVFGSVDMDFSEAALPPDVGIVVLSVFGSTRIRLREEQRVHLTGFSVFGERYVESPRLEVRSGAAAPRRDPTSAEPPIEVAAFSVFGNLDVVRDA